MGYTSTFETALTHVSDSYWLSIKNLISNVSGLMGFAIPINMAREALDQLVKGPGRDADR